MTNRIVTENIDGSVSLTVIAGEDPGGYKLAKALFILSRLSGTVDSFNPDIHTVDAIAEGITGHRSLSVLGYVEDDGLPGNRDNRNNWVWDSINNKVVDPGR